MAVQLFTNNAASVLLSAITDSELTLPLLTTTGFPEPTAGDFFLATLVGYDGNGNENAWEIVKITANSTALDTLTVASGGRGQEGTTALAWAQATRIELRLTAGATESKANLGTAAYTASTAYAPAAQGVTNGNSHDHAGGDGGQIAYSGLSGLPTLGNAAAKDVGTGSTQVAAGDHAHSGVYQPADTELTALAGLAVTDSNFIVGNGTTWVAESGATARTSLGLGTAATAASTDFAPATGSSVYAPLASPALTGSPTAPTATQGDSDTSIATTAFVNAEIAADAAPLAHVGGTGSAHGNATTSVAGFMSSTDKTKLDGVATGATANTGTVTSVGLSLPAEFTVTNSPVTTSGTLTATKASQTANTFFAAPNGSAGAPTFRALVVADVPTFTTHDHAGGDGGQIAYSGLSGLPTLGNSASRDVGTGSTQVAAGDHNHSAVYQALDSDLTALAGLSTTGLIERTGAGTAAIVAKPSGAIVGTTDTQTLSGKTITALKETKTASSGYNFDLAAGNYFTHNASANNLTVSNVAASGAVASFIVELTNGGAYTFAFWSGVKWAGGTVPALTASGVDILGFYTHDGGTTWRGLVLAKDSK